MINKMKKTMKKRKINKIKKHEKNTRRHKKTIKRKRYYKNGKYSKKFKGGKICLEKDPTQCLVEVSKIDKKSSSGTGIVLRSLSPNTVTPSGLSLPIIPPPSGFKLPPPQVISSGPLTTSGKGIVPPRPPPPPGSPITIDLTKRPRVTDEQIELFGELVKNGETDDVIREKMITSGVSEDDVNFLLTSNSNQSTPTETPSGSIKLVTTEIPPPPPPLVSTIGKGIPPPPPPPPVSNNRPPISFLQQLNNPEIQKNLKKPLLDVNNKKGEEKLTLFEKRFQGKDTTTEEPKIYPTDISDYSDDDSDDNDEDLNFDDVNIPVTKIQANPRLIEAVKERAEKKFKNEENKKLSLGNIGKNENVIKMVETAQMKDQSSDIDNDDWDTDSQDGGKMRRRHRIKIKSTRKKDKKSSRKMKKNNKTRK